MASTADGGAVRQLSSGLYVTGFQASLPPRAPTSATRPTARIAPAAVPSEAQSIAQAAQVAKATSDYGVLGEAMSTNAIASALSNEARAWQMDMLRDAAIHWWLYKRNPWVRTCVDLIAQRATADDYAIDSVSKDDRGIAALQVFLARINPRQSFKRMLRGVYRDRQINGNWYGRVQFDSRNTPVALYRVDFRTIVPCPEPSGSPQVYHLYVNGRNDLRPIEIPAREIIHLTLNDAGENGCGLSPLESLDATLAEDQAARAYNTGFFQNGAKAGDIYQMDPDLGPDQVERERQYLKENFTKPSQSFEPLLLQGKTALLRDGSQIQKDLEFQKAYLWNREEVAAVFSVPVSLITGQVGQLGGNGKEADSIMFNEMVIAPEQKAVFEDFNRELLEERFRNRDLCLVAPKISGVRLDLVQAASAMLEAGATGNEARRVMRLDDLEGMDDPVFKMPGLTVVGQPGHPDSVLLTNRGAFLADPLDPKAAQTQQQILSGQTNGPPADHDQDQHQDEDQQQQQTKPARKGAK